jgi:hypothetical protein
MIAVGSFGDDIANAVKKAPWNILFTEGFEECKNDKGCRAFVPCFIIILILMGWLLVLQKSIGRTV